MDKEKEIEDYYKRAGEIQYNVMLMKAMLDQINQEIFKLKKPEEKDPTEPTVFRPNVVFGGDA